MKNVDGNVDALNRNLKIVFDETTTPLFGGEWDGASRRYTARALGDGAGWGVYDRASERFLLSREVATLSEREIREHWSN